MGSFHKVQVGNEIITPIDWEMSPDLSFGTYESWGGRERVRNNDERVYYFFVDNWGDTPKLCLMERAIKHAKVLAEVDAPLSMVASCVKTQGASSRFEKSYAINDEIRDWLIENVLDGKGNDRIQPLESSEEHESMGISLSEFDTSSYQGAEVTLPSIPSIINDEDLAPLLKKHDFYDSDLNHSGVFENRLSALGEDVVVDERTGLMWQRGGLDIASIRSMQRMIGDVNKAEFAGFTDWRMPTMEEAMSLMEPVRNNKLMFLHSCFSKEQPFVFVAAQRQPGGYWFVDFKQGRAFWSSGTIPGGFGRLVRKI